MLEIIQEGPGWAAIDKPAGIATERHFLYDTVEARAQVQWKREGAKKDPFVGIVHRLDRPTSGVLLLARNKSTLVKLNRSFAEGNVSKTYRAVTATPLPSGEGELRGYLGRTPDRKKAFVNTRPTPDTKEAILGYRLLRESGGRYLYEVTPATGRFHQIRAQFAAVGAPLLGDQLYGDLHPLREHTIALHAFSLTFPDPKNGENTTVEADLPDYFPLEQP